MINTNRVFFDENVNGAQRPNDLNGLCSCDSGSTSLASGPTRWEQSSKNQGKAIETPKAIAAGEEKVACEKVLGAARLLQSRWKTREVWHPKTG